VALPLTLKTRLVLLLGLEDALLVIPGWRALSLRLTLAAMTVAEVHHHLEALAPMPASRSIEGRVAEISVSDIHRQNLMRLITETS
jgi:hypothetical protein